MKITNKELAELFKSALVAYENEPNKGVGPDGYCYDTLAGGRVAIEMAAAIIFRDASLRHCLVEFLLGEIK